jgi:hypothetical protein
MPLVRLFVSTIVREHIDSSQDEECTEAPLQRGFLLEDKYTIHTLHTHSQH